MRVILSPSKLQAYNIAASEVADALRETNENATAGVMIEGGQEFLVALEVGILVNMALNLPFQPVRLRSGQALAI